MSQIFPVGSLALGHYGTCPLKFWEKINGTYGSVDFLKNAMYTTQHVKLTNPYTQHSCNN